MGKLIILRTSGNGLSEKESVTIRQRYPDRIPVAWRNWCFPKFNRHIPLDAGSLVLASFVEFFLSGPFLGFLQHVVRS